MTARNPLLSVKGVETYYGNIRALNGVDVAVNEGEIVALIGANGAGKSTTLKAISGILFTERGSVTKGSITLEGKPIHGTRPFDVTKLGIAQVFEGRRVFESLSGGGDHELGEACHAPSSLVFDELLWFPCFDLARDLAGEVDRVDEMHVVDAGTAVDQVVPEFSDGLTGRGDSTETGDDNTRPRAKRFVHEG